MKHDQPQPARRPLMMWTIYDHPKDAPDFFVARLWLIADRQAVPTTETMSETDLDTLRKYLELAGLHRLPRQEDDDPVIIETWL